MFPDVNELRGGELSQVQVGRLLCLSCHLCCWLLLSGECGSWKVNFSRCRAPWFWAAPPQLSLLNPHKSSGVCTTLTRHTGARTTWGDPAGSYCTSGDHDRRRRKRKRRREKRRRRKKAMLGFAYELSLLAVHGASLVAGSASNPAFFCEKKFPSNNSPLSRTNLLAPINPNRAHDIPVPPSQLLTARVMKWSMSPSGHHLSGAVQWSRMDLSCTHICWLLEFFRCLSALLLHQ